MDMYREILSFYDTVEDNDLKAGAISLWFALLHKANRSGWKEWFVVSGKKLEALSGQGKTAIWENLRVLKACGRIDYRTAKGKKTEFRLLTRSPREPLCEPLCEPLPGQDANHFADSSIIERRRRRDVYTVPFVDVVVDVPARQPRKTLRYGTAKIPDEFREHAEAWWDNCCEPIAFDSSAVNTCYQIFAFASELEGPNDWDFKTDIAEAIEAAGDGAERPAAYIIGVFQKWYIDYLPDNMKQGLRGRQVQGSGMRHKI